MEKFARQAINDGVTGSEELSVSRDCELFRALNMHYNKANDFEVNMLTRLSASAFLFHVAKIKMLKTTDDDSIRCKPFPEWSEYDETVYDTFSLLSSDVLIIFSRWKSFETM